MNKTCAYTTLKNHSAGKSYSPVQVVLGSEVRYRLQNADGDVLVGLHGNFFNFKSEKNATNWLCTNLGRIKNATEPTSVDYVGQLHEIYSKTQDSFVMAEINAIRDLDAGLWVPVECSAQIVYIDNSTKDWDGGNAFDI